MEKLSLLKSDYQVLKAHTATKKEQYALQCWLVQDNKIYATNGKVLAEYALPQGLTLPNGIYFPQVVSSKSFVDIILEPAVDIDFPKVLQYIMIPNEQVISHYIEYNGHNLTSLALKIYSLYKVAVNVDYLGALPECDFNIYVYAPDKPILCISKNKQWRIIILPFKMN